MKKLMMMAIAAAVALSTPALADDDKDKAPKKKRGNIFAELGLSKDKLKHINKVLKPIREKQASLRKQKDLPRKERAAKYKEINTERDVILKKCLSEAEFKKYQDAMAKRRADRKKKSKNKDE